MELLVPRHHCSSVSGFGNLAISKEEDPSETRFSRINQIRTQSTISRVIPKESVVKQKTAQRWIAVVTVSLCVVSAYASLGSQQARPPEVVIGATDIGGVVTSASGPEAGVWVIAETTDLPTKYTKIVVTDDQGRFVIPDLPKANYSVWVRGYGLVDSQKVQGEPGKTLNLTATVAPNPAAAAKYYPGMYWYSMIKIPEKSEFPGTGDKGNGMPETLKSQHAFVDYVKNSCQSCHALGSEGVRVVPEIFKKDAKDSADAWARRTQAGQAMSNMALTLGRIGPDKAYHMF